MAIRSVLRRKTSSLESGEPFVFQVAAALKRFSLKNPEKKVADFSIGTPPTSIAIWKEQLKILFGFSENCFPEESAEDFLFRPFSAMIYRMGSYERSGGCDQLLDQPLFFDLDLPKGTRATVISGGQKTARRLWHEIQLQFPGVQMLEFKKGLDVGDSNKLFLLSSDLLERCSLALFIGSEDIVSSLMAVHTGLFGTPSAPQEDIYFLLSSGQFRNVLKSNVDGSPALEEFRRFIVSLEHDELPLLLKKANRIKKVFSRRFIDCFFPTLSNQPYFHFVPGNGGGRQALHAIETALIHKGIEKMLIFEPFWTYHNVYTRLEIEALPSVRNKPDLEKLELLLKKNSRPLALTINSPNNPTGHVYSRDILKKLLVLSERYGLYLIDDACYIRILRLEETNRDDLFSVAYDMVKNGDLDKRVLQKTFAALTVSKGLGMAGARIGGVFCYGKGILPILEKEYEQEMPNMMAFFIAEKLCKNISSFQNLLVKINTEIDERIDLVTKIFDKAGLLYEKPAGAFYIQLKVPFLQGKIVNMKNFALQMAEEKGMAFMPMEIYGGEQFALRLSLGGKKSLQQLETETRTLVYTLTMLK